MKQKWVGNPGEERTLGLGGESGSCRPRSGEGGRPRGREQHELWHRGVRGHARGLRRCLLRLKKRTGPFDVRFGDNLLKHSTCQLTTKSMTFGSICETTGLKVSIKVTSPLTLCFSRLICHIHSFNNHSITASNAFFDKQNVSWKRRSSARKSPLPCTCRVSSGTLETHVILARVQGKE